MLHDHTSYPQVAVFPDHSQSSYSRINYPECSTRFETESELAGCVDWVSREFPEPEQERRTQGLFDDYGGTPDDDFSLMAKDDFFKDRG
ncbi:hypothetical protein ACIQSO_09645 [Pseudomonas putida]|uniref:hypothetical protein n=1 Tax=Pseudomonas putida TaxID=303 RepID=UPI00383A17DD